MGIETAILGAVIAGAGVSAYSAKKQSDAQKKAQRSAEAIAEKQKNQAEREFNRANAKTPDLAGIMASNKRAEGAGSTMLTGPQGVSQDALSLGGSSRLTATRATSATTTSTTRPARARCGCWPPA